jgi:hypothetical protein
MFGEKMIEHRHNRRFSISQVAVLYRRGRRITSCDMWDLSPQGAGLFVGPLRFSPYVVLQIAFSVPALDGRMEIGGDNINQRAMVVHCSRGILGLMFCEPSVEARERIQRFCQQTHGQPQSRVDTLLLKTGAGGR